MAGEVKSTEWYAAISELKFHAREERKIQESLVSEGNAGKGDGKSVCVQNKKDAIWPLQ